MAVPLEPTIDSLDDAVIRTPRIHFCGGKFMLYTYSAIAIALAIATICIK